MRNTKLYRLIRFNYDSIREFASDMGMSQVNASNLINGKTGWTEENVRKACDLLSIPQEQVGEVFYAKE